MRNRSVEDYVDDYFLVDKFKKAYEHVIKPMTDRNQWPEVDMGFKLWPPLLKRAAGRPRTRRIKGVEEGGKSTFPETVQEVWSVWSHDEDMQ